MKLLRLAIETEKWELAAHILILAAITARLKEHGKASSKKKKKQTDKRSNSA